MPTRHNLTQTQLESLTSPSRLAIIQRLELDRQATVRELAQRMGRSATALYHHLKHLEEAGLIRIVGQRKGPRRPEAIYAMIADHVSSAEAVKTMRGRRTYGRAGARIADASGRAFSAAAANLDTRFEGRYRNAMVRFFVLRADKKKIAVINKLLDELEGAALRSCDEGEEIRLTVLLSPMRPKD